MSGYIYDSEYYVCPNCAKSFDQDTVHRHWKCPYCGEHIIIYVRDKSFQKVFKRISAEEISDNDLVYFHQTDKGHTVFNKYFKDGKYHIIIKEHGTLKLREEEWINCVWGSWDGDENKLIKDYPMEES